MIFMKHVRKFDNFSNSDSKRVNEEYVMPNEYKHLLVPSKQVVDREQVAALQQLRTGMAASSEMGKALDEVLLALINSSGKWNLSGASGYSPEELKSIYGEFARMVDPEKHAAYIPVIQKLFGPWAEKMGITPEGGDGKEVEVEKGQASSMARESYRARK